MYKLVDSVTGIYQDFYPYINNTKIEVQRKIEAEEKAFLKNLDEWRTTFT